MGSYIFSLLGFVGVLLLIVGPLFGLSFFLFGFLTDNVKTKALLEKMAMSAGFAFLLGLALIVGTLFGFRYTLSDLTEEQLEEESEEKEVELEIQSDTPSLIN